MDNRFNRKLEQAAKECDQLWQSGNLAYPPANRAPTTSSGHFTSDENDTHCLRLKPGHSAYAAIGDLFEQTTTLTCIMRQQLVLLRSLWCHLPPSFFDICFSELVIIDAQLEAWLPVHGYQLPVRSRATDIPNPLTWFFLHAPANHPARAGDLITFFNDKNFLRHLLQYQLNCWANKTIPDTNLCLGRYHATLALSAATFSTADQGTMSAEDVRAGLAEEMQTIRPPSSAADQPSEEEPYHSHIDTQKIASLLEPSEDDINAFKQWFQQIKGLSRLMKNSSRPTKGKAKSLKKLCPKHTQAIKENYNNEGFICGKEAYCRLIIAQQEELLQTESEESLRTLCHTLLTFAAHCRYAYQLHAAIMLYQTADYISQVLLEMGSPHREKIKRRLQTYRHLKLFQELNTPQGQRQLKELYQLSQQKNQGEEVQNVLLRPPFNEVNTALLTKLDSHFQNAEKGGENESAFEERLLKESNALLRRELIGVTDENLARIGAHAEKKAEAKQPPPPPAGQQHALTLTEIKTPSDAHRPNANP